MALVFTENGPQVVRIAGLIDAEFREMPGMRLTEAQVRRLCNLSEPDCEEALHLLCDRGDLVRDESGRYLRRRFDY